MAQRSWEWPVVAAVVGVAAIVGMVIFLADEGPPTQAVATDGSVAPVEPLTSTAQSGDDERLLSATVGDVTDGDADRGFRSFMKGLVLGGEQSSDGETTVDCVWVREGDVLVEVDWPDSTVIEWDPLRVTSPADDGWGTLTAGSVLSAQVAGRSGESSCTGNGRLRLLRSAEPPGPPFEIDAPLRTPAGELPTQLGALVASDVVEHAVTRASDTCPTLQSTRGELLMPVWPWPLSNAPEDIADALNEFPQSTLLVVTGRRGPTRQEIVEGGLDLWRETLELGPDHRWLACPFAHLFVVDQAHVA